MAVDVTITDVSSGYNRSAINDNFDKIDVAIQDAVSRSGTSPNQMEADFDLNSNDLLNVNVANIANLKIGGTAVVPTDVVHDDTDIKYIFKTVADLLADTRDLTYFTVGDYVLAGGFRYEVVVSGHVQNSAVTPIQFDVLSNSDNTMNVMAFNAAGDGVTDDTAVIQVALDAAAGVAKLAFGAGTFMISAEPHQAGNFPYTGGMVIPSNTHMVLGNETTIGTITNGYQKGLTCSVYQVDNVTIEGGNWVGDWETHAFDNLFETKAKMDVGDYRTRTINNGTNIFTAGDVGYIYQDGGNNGTYLYDGAVWNLTSGTTPPYITHEFHAAVDIRRSTNVKMLNMQISDFVGDGIFVNGVGVGDPVGTHGASPKNILISGCTIEASRRNGIAIVGGDDVVMIGNHINDTGIRKYNQDGTAPRTGIDIESGGFVKSDRITISGNTFKGNVSGSVNTYDGNNISVTGNVADSTISYGFGVNIVISGNVLSWYPDKSAGIPLITANDTRVPVAGTWSQSGTTITVTAGSAHSHGVGGEVWFEDDDGTSGLSGLYTVTSAADTVTLTFEVETSATASGTCEIKYQTSNVVISGNSLRGGGIKAFGEHVLIEGNIIDTPKGDGASGATGLSIFAAEDVMVCGNKLRGGDALDYGVRVHQSNEVTVMDNVIHGGSVAGIFLSQAAGNKAYIFNNIAKEFSGSGLRIEGNAAHETIAQGNAFRPLAASTSTAIWHRYGTAYILDNKVFDAAGYSFLNDAGAISIVKGNSFIRGTNLVCVNIAADDTQVINNIVTMGKQSNNWHGIATYIDSPLVSGNILYNETAFTASQCINTSGGTNARVLYNISDGCGALLNDGTDTVTGNIIS